MMAVDIGRFAGVIRFLMQPFDPRHLLGLLGDFDAIAGQQQPTVNLNQWASGQNDLPPPPHDIFQLPGRCPEKGKQRRIPCRLYAKPAHKGADTIMVNSNDKTDNDDDKPFKGRLAAETGSEL